MTDDDAREIVRATLAHHVHGTWHGYTHAEVRQALERALVLFDEVERCEVTGNPVGTDTRRVGHTCPCSACSKSEPTTAELRAEAERLAREVWGDGAGLSHSTNRRVVDASCRIVMDMGICDTLVDEPTALRALVAALREIRRGDG